MKTLSKKNVFLASVLIFSFAFVMLIFAQEIPIFEPLPPEDPSSEPILLEPTLPEDTPEEYFCAQFIYFQENSSVSVSEGMVFSEKEITFDASSSRDPCFKPEFEIPGPEDPPLPPDQPPLSDPEYEIISYSWDFGDGDSAVEKITTHTYAKSGEYVVTLTVINGYGFGDSVSRPINVEMRCDFSTQLGIEKCFGGIGTQCEGDALLYFDQDENTCLVHGWMSVGSILHDQCCLTDNTGFMCSTKNWRTGKCRQAFMLAAQDLLCDRFWEETFGPYFAGNTRNKTSQYLRAPSGSRVHPKHQSLCQSGQCQVNAKGKTIIRWKGFCKYCICSEIRN